MNSKKWTLYMLALLGTTVVIAGVYLLYNNLSQRELNKQTLATNRSQSAASSHSPEAATAAKTGAASAQEAREPAPDLSVSAPDAAVFKLSDARGKIVVLNFWASWCPPCKAEFPDFQSFYDQVKGRDDIQFAFINLIGANGETKEDADAFIKDNGYSVPYYYDDELKAAEAYLIRSIPTTIIVDADGGIVYRKAGMMSLDELEKAVKKAAP